MGESRQRYNETFKREAVKYVQEQSKSLEQIADELKLHALRVERADQNDSHECSSTVCSAHS